MAEVLNMKALTNKKTVAELVEIYTESMAKVETAYKLLEESERALTENFDFYITTIDRYAASHKADENIKNIRSQIKRSIWGYLINQLGIRKLLSLKEAEAFDKRLREEELPEITNTNIFNMMQSLIAQSREYSLDAIIEVYNYLRPERDTNTELKTNEKNGRYDLGKKVILFGIIDISYAGEYPYKVSYWKTDALSAVDRAFALLDGKPIDTNAYHSPLIDAINMSYGKGETEYFKFVAYANGNLHLTFKRLDLVRKMNQIAGNPGELKGQRV